MSEPRPPSGRPLLLGMGWFPDQPGGLNRYFTGLYRALGDRLEGCRAVVTGPVAAPPANVHVAGSVDEPTALRTLRYARAAIRQTSAADVVDAHFAFYALLPTLMSRLRGKPLVVHFHGPWAEESAAAGEASKVAIRVKAAVERIVYREGIPPRRALGGVQAVPGRTLRRLTLDSFTWFLRASSWNDSFQAIVAQARAALGIEDQAWVAVAVRRLVPRMGLDVLLDAWAEADAPLEGALLLIAGDGPERAALEQQADALVSVGECASWAVSATPSCWPSTRLRTSVSCPRLPLRGSASSSWRRWPVAPR